MAEQTQRTEIEQRPLYVQVRENLRERIRAGSLKPGAPLPNEFELARELGVSQGTVRKALDALAAEKLITRAPGRGTFVREQTAADNHFRFFHLYDASGARISPDSRDIRVMRARATRAEAERLSIARTAVVIRMSRLRTRSGRPFMTEEIVVPAALFPGLESLSPMPNTLYDLFQNRYGVTVARAEERLTPVVATADVAARLMTPQGAPLLRIERVAFALDDRPIEWRTSLCNVDDAYYFAVLG